MFKKGAGIVCLRLAENCDFQQKSFLLRAEVYVKRADGKLLKTVVRYKNVAIHALTGKKNILERICGSYVTNILCLTQIFSTYCVHETHILCLTHPFSKYLVFMKHSVPGTPFH